MFRLFIPLIAAFLATGCASSPTPVPSDERWRDFLAPERWACADTNPGTLRQDLARCKLQAFQATQFEHQVESRMFEIAAQVGLCMQSQGYRMTNVAVARAEDRATPQGPCDAFVRKIEIAMKLRTSGVPINRATQELSVDEIKRIDPAIGAAEADELALKWAVIVAAVYELPKHKLSGPDRADHLSGIYTRCRATQ